MVHPARSRVLPLRFEALDRHPLLRGRAGARLGAALTVHRAAPGEVLVEEGETPGSVLLVLSGSVQATVAAEDGREGQAGLMLAPAVVGGLEALVGSASPATFRAMEHVRLAALPSSAWCHALEQDPALRLEWLALASQERRGLYTRHRRTLFAGLERRLAELLVEYVELYGLPVPGGLKLRVRLRHEDLADALGAARRSVTRILSEWRLKGWVFHEGGSFVVAQVEALRGLSAE